MIDVTDFIKEEYRLLYLLDRYSREPYRSMLLAAVPMKKLLEAESYSEYPSYVCSTTQEIFLEARNGCNIFNVFLPQVRYQKIEGERDKFHLSDGLTRIEAHELWPSIWPWRRIDRKLDHGEKIFVAGRYYLGDVEVFYYKNLEPRGKRRPKFSALERRCLALATTS